MIGTIQYVNEKEGKRGKYLTLALEDGTKGLVVNDETTMEGELKGSAIKAVKEGETYDFTVEKSGVFTIVTGISPAVAGSEPEKTPVSPPKQPRKPSLKPQAGSYQSEYMKKRTPKETEIIAKQAFAKALIGAYARLWGTDKTTSKNLDEFNTRIRDDADEYVAWLEIEK